MRDAIRRLEPPLRKRPFSERLFWYLDFGVTARHHPINRRHDLADSGFNEIPVIRTQHQQRHFPAGEILLVADFLIRRDEKVEARFFRRRWQRLRFLALTNLETTLLRRRGPRSTDVVSAERSHPE